MEFDVAIVEAEKELGKAKTKEDVAAVWKKHYLTVGHRALGRLLVGKSSAELIEKKAS